MDKYFQSAIPAVARYEYIWSKHPEAECGKQIFISDTW